MTFSFLYPKLSHPSDILTNLVKELLRMAWSYFSSNQNSFFWTQSWGKKKESGSAISHQPVPVITNQQWLLVRSYSTLEPVCSVRSVMGCIWLILLASLLLFCCGYNRCVGLQLSVWLQILHSGSFYFSARILVSCSGCFLWGGNAV